MASYRAVLVAAALIALPAIGAARAPLTMEALGTLNTGGAEISAYDAGSRRLFVTNAGNDSVAIVDASSPSSLVQIGTIDVSALGSPNSVAARDGLVAVAIESPDKVSPGVVAFYRTSGHLLGTVQVGSLPDMLTFTPNGQHLLVANEAEPDGYGPGYTDPEGTISIIRVPQGRKWSTPSVRTVDFTGFNGREDELRSAGIRIYGPGASAAQDLEPEYIAVSDDSRIAWVTLQENNAVAKIDILRGKVLSLLPLGYKDWSRQPYAASIFEWTADKMPPIGVTPAGQVLKLGGFSGLAFEGVTGDGELKFIANTDRGPNAEPTGLLRPFLLPDFNPRLVRFTLDPANGRIRITQQILLRDSSWQPLTGLPNLAVAGGTANSPHNDEIPVDLKNNVLGLDPRGGDFEGVVIDEDGSFWLCDEYRPAIYHFSERGVLIARYIPVGAHAAAGLPVPAAGVSGALGIEALPAVLAQRRQNRGMEAIALRDGKIYGFVQSPVRNPTTLSNGTLNAMQNVRIVELDPATLATRQFIYIMDNPPGAGEDSRADKIGDAVATPEGFLVVERDDDSLPSGDAPETILKKVYAFTLAGATPITAANDILYGGKTLDQMTSADFLAAGIVPIANTPEFKTKTLEVDLVAAGYADVQKVEGLALLDDGRLAVVNDNDFQVASIVPDTTNGTFTLDPDYVPEHTVIGLIERPGLDASDRDNRINIRPWPVLGMYQPDAIDSYKVRGRSYFVTVNEGDARTDWPPFDEEARIGSLTLDGGAFPTGATLKNNANLGRLKVTRSLGDTDGDGDFDELYVYGARSFSIWDSDGDLIFDSGSQLERLTAAENPDLFNASHTSGDVSLDNRSDDKGPEPEALAIGRIGERTFAFIGLERFGGVAAYDISDPYAPLLVDYLNTRSFSGDPEAGDLGPEGLVFIPAHESPTRGPLLAVTSEVSGTVSLYELDTGRPGRRLGWSSWKRGWKNGRR